MGRKNRKKSVAKVLEESLIKRVVNNYWYTLSNNDYQYSDVEVFIRAVKFSEGRVNEGTPRAYRDIALDFLTENFGIGFNGNDLKSITGALEYFYAHREQKSYKVAMMFICLNPLYWPFAKDAIEGSNKFFLPGHKVDHFLWSDMPQEVSYGATVFPTEPVVWPLPTLFRYHLFLQQEDKLKDYDYVFYCDIDMKWVNIVGDEILCDGLTVAPHPMYYLQDKFVPPYDHHPESSANVDTPGFVYVENNQPKFRQMYAAGGFQGGKTPVFIEAMKKMKEMIDSDFMKNYTARWNDESHWNAYLWKYPKNEKNFVYLTPAYVYPDSLIEDYYVKLWGRNFKPKLITLTKKFSTTQSAGEAIAKNLEEMKGL